ncbi:aspartate-semialdehyde dehydrogenase [Ancylomarina euxinus]|uniref:Aspartate-semialdehyde dehydrogenase n=1 Tax=Ancylomarina euxinus TaxID=2283627 RepID=A0A425Y944_9BACT|nr:aspartate-semialdehyde dehydrogenase [Ancylomarina euxinus]MCZ4693266.1 aspartate-semialdehyde dehydrogenase [Ancylomarina euxinus]MUP13493.1 aspartate-semialdehyde dehydrogenase [Ancylomarina euxinus]RRG24854.1 aspartate-semialdehyde dehydrogenase [Ancylomarina euxinus]
MKIAVVGATGLVGQKILEVLTERNFPVDELYPVASERSKGKKIEFRGKQVTVIGMKEAIELKPHIAIFSAGGDTSLEWAPEFEKVGTFVVDNSSAWRMHPEKKLIVPEINASELSVDDKIIANPNCSTIQMVVALAPLHKKYKIKRLIISTYQSISGTGVKAVEQLENERAGIDGEMAYPYPIDKNCLPHCDVFEDNAYTKEEMKLINETKKILCDDSIRITATAVRVPVVGGHSESVNIEFEKDFDLDELKELLAHSEGIVLQDEPDKNIYPMPRFAHDKDQVFVGRIRRDFSNPNSLNMWIVADNLRKGAATNAIQIAEYLTKSGIVK